jgi:hypothetical protein
LASRLPPRLSLWRFCLPEDASIGDTPHSAAKEASAVGVIARGYE